VEVSIGSKLVGPSREEISIPDSVFYVLERVAEVMARGEIASAGPDSMSWLV
jgi:hypothetical protein